MTSKKKNGFLLIGVFSKPINTQNYGHQDLFLGGLFIESQGLKVRVFERSVNSSS
jgi:hypothetical protein